MKTLKKADCIIQSVLLMAGIVLVLAPGKNFDERVQIAYYLVAGWNIVSVMAHFFYPSSFQNIRRKLYLVVLAATIIVVGLTLLLKQEGEIAVMFGLMFFSPFMVISYILTCIDETRELYAAEASPEKSIE